MFNRIIVAVDLADPDPARPALQQVADMARSNGEIRLIHVRPFMVQAALAYLPDNYFEKEEQEALEALRAIARESGLPVDRVSVESPIGTPYDSILQASRAFEADLIVVGSHRPAMSTYLLGSNAARIVRHAQCSVLVVR